ncbi:hypothetical protein [Photobacterium damselae]|uniref:hypothetical protein n=1 Tax=Photobacterium damselae TaxID=38293 RepID=UPI001C634E43|nr:hypothetical protein [Photobacterium damselae]
MIEPLLSKDGNPTLMPEKMLLNQFGLGVDSALINMLSKHVINQSSKPDEQSETILIFIQELQEKAKLKKQLLD